jgi:uncharacterized protein YxjI
MTDKHNPWFSIADDIAYGASLEPLTIGNIKQLTTKTEIPKTLKDVIELESRNLVKDCNINPENDIVEIKGMSWDTHIKLLNARDYAVQAFRELSQFTENHHLGLAMNKLANLVDTLNDIVKENNK